MTTSPSNEAELQLYRVMQRASLLAYYDTLLEMGGDDVQQLCDAGEEEFLEIMALVGMASKPLHVRRLQKALQEWVTNPGLFQSPLLPSGLSSPIASCCPPAIIPAAIPTPSAVCTTPTIPSTPTTVPFVPSVCASVKEVPRPRSSPQQMVGETSQVSSLGPSTSPGPSPGSPSTLQLTPVLMDSQINRLAEAARALVKNLPQFEPKPHNTKKKICRDLENVMTMPEEDPRRMEEIRKYAAIYGRFDCKRKPEKPLTLHEVSVNEAAAQICRFAPALLTRRDELFPLARQVVRDSGYHYSKTHSSMTPMYRTHSHNMKSLRNGDDILTGKRPRLDGQSPPGSELSESERIRRQERLEAIADELRSLGERTEELVSAAQQVREKNDVASIHSLQQQMEVVQNKQTQLLVEQSELLKQPLPMRIYRRNSINRSTSYLETEKADTDDTDSQMSFSNTSSPLHEVGDSRESLGDGTSNNNLNLNGKSLKKDEKLSQVMSDCLSDDEGMENNDDNYEPFYHDTKVISASGGNIIAVANPALSMSPRLPSSDSLTKLNTQTLSTSPLSLKMERLVDPD